jgi:sugar O-acyltransferase (sialic acid O-acetyltransferase NeuD family)
VGVRRVGILGAGRQALETSGYCREEGLAPAFFFEEKPPEYERDARVYEAPLLGLEDELTAWQGVRVVGAVGSPKLRRQLVARWPGTEYMTLVSSRAWSANDVVIGAGATICPLVGLNRFVRVGYHVLINVGAIVSHDVVIGDFATVSPGCVIGGGVRIAEDAFLGIGAVVRDHVRIGRGAFVAAGAVVVDNVEDGHVVMGVPARPSG